MAVQASVNVSIDAKIDPKIDAEPTRDARHVLAHRWDLPGGEVDHARALLAHHAGERHVPRLEAQHPETPDWGSAL